MRMWKQWRWNLWHLLQINRIQIEPECEEDAIRMIEQHVKHLFRLYSR